MKWQKGTFWLLFMAIYGVGIGYLPLFMPDETRYAEIPREMLEAKNWSVPTLNGLPYFEKPVLGYWAVACSMAVFGETELAVRLPAALAVLLTALVMARFMQFVGFGAYRYQAAIVFMSCLLVACLGRLALLDSLFSLCVCLSVVLYFVGSNITSGRQSAWVFAAGAAAGLAFLVKGFLGFLLPALILGPFFVWQGMVKSTLSRVHWAIFGALIVPLPWALMVHAQEADFWRYFIWVEHIQRFFSAPKSQHPEPWWYYLPALGVGTFPWVFYLIGKIRLKMSAPMETRFVRLLLCWILFPVAFFSISSGKLLTYVLPVFPAFAMLLCVIAKTRSMKTLAFPRHVHLWIGMSIIGLGLTTMIVSSFSFYQPNESGTAQLFSWVIVAVGALVVWSRNTNRSSLGIALAMATFMVSLPWILPTKLMERKAPVELIEQSHVHLNDQMTIVSDSSMIHSVNWTLKRKCLYMIGDRGELDYGLNYHPQLWLQESEFKDLILASAEHGLALFTTQKTLATLNVPTPDLQSGNQKFVYLIWKPIVRSSSSPRPSS